MENRDGQCSGLNRALHTLFFFFHKWPHILCSQLHKEVVEVEKQRHTKLPSEWLQGAGACLLKADYWRRAH